MNTIQEHREYISNPYGDIKIYNTVNPLCQDIQNQLNDLDNNKPEHTILPHPSLKMKTLQNMIKNETWQEATGILSYYFYFFAHM